MLKGSCLCGRLQYELHGTPMAMYYCHCRTCRKASGTQAATNIMARAQDLVVVAGRELLKGFESSPEKQRYFCSNCGSPIYSHSQKSPQVISLRCGSLDSDPGTRPSLHLHVASKAPWDVICDELPQRPESF